MGESPRIRCKKTLFNQQLIHKAQLSETKGIVSKWNRTGLLEGLDNEYEKHGMAILLENQAKQLIEMRGYRVREQKRRPGLRNFPAQSIGFGSLGATSLYLSLLQHDQVVDVAGTDLLVREVDP